MTELKKLDVDLGTRSYEILIGGGLLEQLGKLLAPRLAAPQVAIVTNRTIAPLYLDRVRQALTREGISSLPILLPDGEIYKTWQHLHTIFDTLIENRLERSTTLVALGGGVVGDMTGYAAASFLRGVDFIQIPTTLLAQVDASVGGKTGINHPLGKNLIGAFYQPRLVAIDLETLATLPRRELLAGLAEVIKYGLIWDEALFSELEKGLEEILSLAPGKMGRIIHTCCAIKAEVVARDERESGTRALLNLGHTFGHAIEKLAGYGHYLHGEAVAIGMLMAADLSVRLALCPEMVLHRTRHLLERAGLPTTPPTFPVEAWLEAMARDKKVGGQPRFVLLEKVGKARIHAQIPPDALKATIENIQA